MEAICPPAPQIKRKKKKVNLQTPQADKKPPSTFAGKIPRFYLYWSKFFLCIKFGEWKQTNAHRSERAGIYTSLQHLYQKATNIF